MIIVRLQGGLGNQMFQYALGRVLSIKNKTELKLDTSFFGFKNIPKRSYDLDVFNITASIATKKDIPTVYRLFNSKFSNRLIASFRKIIRNKGKEKYFAFDTSVLSIGSNAYLDGYWQSPKYFKEYKDQIRKDFTLKNKPDQNIQVLVEEISKVNSVCIHVRRGDYVGNKNHEVIGVDYYKKGLEQISKLKTIEMIYVFSDDIEWCKSNLKFEFPTIFVDDSSRGIKGEGHMFLMSKCHNFIIANSSFSWWAAWLSDNPDKIVICPKQWFGDASIDTSDLIPPEWIRI